MERRQERQQIRQRRDNGDSREDIIKRRRGRVGAEKGGKDNRNNRELVS